MSEKPIIEVGFRSEGEVKVGDMDVGDVFKHARFGLCMRMGDSTDSSVSVMDLTELCAQPVNRGLEFRVVGHIDFKLNE